MRLFCLLVPALVVFGSALPATPAAAAEFAIQEEPGAHIDVLYGNRVVLRLMTANNAGDETAAHDTYKVYAHVMDPVDPDNQRTLTKGPGHQFTHHRGIFIGFSKTNVAGVGGVDTWHMRNGVRQHFGKIVKQQAGDDKATLTVSVDWIKGDQPLLSEERTFVVYKPEPNEAVLIDMIAKITATAGDTVLKGDPEHAGLQYRAHEDVSKNKSAKYLFPAGAKPGNGGTKDMPWAAMTYQAHGNDYHVQHMSHPSLPKGNVYSAYRDYGRFGAYFVEEIAKGETATFKVRFYVSPGKFPERAVEAMQARYEEYVDEVQ